MWRCPSLLVIAACGGAVGAPRTTHEAATGNVAQVQRPRFDVVPAELADPGVLDRIRARAIVRVWDKAWISDNDPLVSGRTDVTNDIVPVLDADGRRIRIVIEDDDARIAPWIARESASRTVLAPTMLGTDDAGITLSPGIPIEIAGTSWGVVDELVAIDGSAKEVPLGYVWVAGERDEPPTMQPVRIRSSEPSPPIAAGKRVLLAQGGRVLAAPARDAKALASAIENVVVEKRGERAGWIHVEVRRPFVRVRGYVDASSISPDDGTSSGSMSGGHAFGVSHAISHELPAGVCLYDRVNGDVVGVTLVARSRIGGSVNQNWAMVYVDTAWRATQLYIQDLGDDPTTPRWEVCARH